MINIRLLFIAIFTLIATIAQSSDKNISISKNKHYVAKIQTSRGDITIVLLNETPLHLANFLTNVEDKVYINMKFHRIISNFVIQIGDPNTKNADFPRKEYGETSQGDNIFPEFTKDAIHTIGAVGMARESDDINPDRLSSGSHFYIVTGGNELTSEMIEKSGKDVGIEYTTEQRHSYLRDGGQARLDGKYVVFGYAIEGMDVVTEISKLPKNSKDIPNENVIVENIKIKKLTNKKLFKEYGYNAK